MVKVSIIMPVYNCEEYLQESIDSVLGQTLQEWELLCVDDGSTDESLAVLEQYQKRDERIRVYTQQNQGAGIARNLGMLHAQGEYIAFLDADDYFFDEDALEKMCQACELHKVDACGSIIKLLRNEIVAEDLGFREVRQAAIKKPVLDYREFQFDYGYSGFIFKASVLKKYEIMFPPYRRFQDPPFFVKAMFQIGKFSFIDKALYCYRTPSVSMRFNAVKTIDLLKGLQENLQFAISNNLALLFERTVQRLEVEYSNIIFHNISSDSTEILELLLQINQMVRRASGKEHYVIAPLKKVLGSVAEAERYQKAELHKSMLDSENIYVYGAGNATRDFLLYLQAQGLMQKVASILVTSKEGNPESIEGIPVIAIDDYRYMKGDFVLITVTSIYRKDIVQKLEELQVAAYKCVDGDMLRF